MLEACKRACVCSRAHDQRKGQQFTTAFYLVMLTALVLITGLWNGVSDFGTAYLQAVLFLEVMNRYDGIVIDRLWVGNIKLWIIKGTADIPYVKTWKQVLKKRLSLTLVWIVGGAVIAGIIVLIF